MVKRFPPPPLADDRHDQPEAPPPPGFEEALRAFAALARLRRETAAALPEAGPDLAFDPEAFAAGEPLLADLAPAALEAGLLRSAAAMLPRLGAIFPALAGEAAALARALAARPDRAAALLTAEAEGREEDLVGLSDAIGLRGATLRFFVRETLAAVLRREAERLAPLAEDALWHKGYCPVCGAAPDMGVLREEPEPSEFLVAKSGRLSLHCSLCGHLWRFTRLKCPACGEEDHEKLALLIPAGRGRERIHVCGSCRRYLPVLDRVELAGGIDLDVAPVGLAHLDAAARARGYEPLCETPWNQFPAV